MYKFTFTCLFFTNIKVAKYYIYKSEIHFHFCSWKDEHSGLWDYTFFMFDSTKYDIYQAHKS